MTSSGIQNASVIRDIAIIQRAVASGVGLRHVSQLLSQASQDPSFDLCNALVDRELANESQVAQWARQAESWGRDDIERVSWIDSSDGQAIVAMLDSIHSQKSNAINTTVEDPLATLPQPSSSGTAQLQNPNAAADPCGTLPTVKSPPADEFATLPLGDSSNPDHPKPSIAATLAHRSSNADADSAYDTVQITRSAGRFGIVRLHARGGLGQVSVAIDEELNREVALKEIQYSYADDQEARARFVREAELTGRLEHPGIVPVYGFGFSENGRPFYAMRFIQGSSFAESIEEFHRQDESAQSNAAENQRRLRFRELIQRFIDVCNTIHYAHSHNVIHRDLKPANIMIGAYGETLVVDWGLAKSLDDTQEAVAIPVKPGSHKRVSLSTETIAGTSMGTPQYMSPEQAEGKSDSIGTASDVYSLGATLYHLIAGRPPFEAQTLSQLLQYVCIGQFVPPQVANRKVPPPLNSICIKAMALKPEDRYASAQDIALELKRWLADEPVLAHGEGWAERWYRRMRRHRAWVMGVATMVPLLLIVMSLAAFFVNAERIKAVQERNIAVDARAKEAEQREIAQKNEQNAKLQEALAQKAAQEAGISLSNLQINNAERSQTEKDFAAAALWSSEALGMFERYDPTLAPIQRVRQHRLLQMLARPTSAFLIPAEVRRAAITYKFAPDGKTLLVLGAIPGAAAVDIESEQLLWKSLPGGSMMAQTIAQNTADSSLVVTCSIEGQVGQWDLKTGQPIGSAMKTTGSTSETFGTYFPLMGLSSDGKFLAVCSTNKDPSSNTKGIVDYFSLSDSKLVYSIAVDLVPRCIQFHPTASEFIVATTAGAQRYAAADGSKIGEPFVQSELWFMRLSPDGKTLVTTTGNGYAQMWDLESGKPVGSQLNHRGPVTWAEFHPMSNLLLTLSADGSGRLWKVPSGESAGSPMDHLERPIMSHFRSDGKAVATIGINHSVSVWSVPQGRLMGGPWLHTRQPDVAFDDSKLRIAVGKHCATWDMSRTENDSPITLELSGSEANMLSFAQFVGPRTSLLMANATRIALVDLEPTPHQAFCFDLPEPMAKFKLSKSGRTLATLSQSGKVYAAELSAMATSSNALELIPWDLKPNVIELDREGQRLVACDESGKAQLWNFKTKSPSTWTVAHQGPVQMFSFNADGSLIASGSADKFVRVWNSDTGELIEEPRLVDDDPNTAMKVAAVQFHPQRDILAAGSDSDQIIVWNVRESSAVPRRFRLSGAVDGLEFSEDGRQLAASGFANHINVWNWEQDKTSALQLPTANFSHIKFSKKGELLASAGAFSSLSLWDTRNGRLVGPNVSLQPRGVDIDSSQRWILTRDSKVHVWKIEPDVQASADLKPLIQAASLRKINNRGAIEFLDSEEFVTTVQKVQSALPIELKPIPIVELMLKP